jgi:hypothetical protein
MTISSRPRISICPSARGRPRADRDVRFAPQQLVKHLVRAGELLQVEIDAGERRRQLRRTGRRTQAVIVSAQAIRMRPLAPAATLRPAITARSAAASATRASAVTPSPAAVGLIPRGRRSILSLPGRSPSVPPRWPLPVYGRALYRPSQ